MKNQDEDRKLQAHGLGHGRSEFARCAFAHLKSIIFIRSNQQPKMKITRHESDSEVFYFLSSVTAEARGVV